MRPRQAAVAALAVIATFGIAGCGGKGAADSLPTPSPSTGAATSPAPGATPTGQLGANPEPAQTRTNASATAFARYFLTLVEQAYQTRSMAQVWPHANRATCASCRYSAKTVRQETRQKFRQINDGPLRFHKIEVTSVSGGVWQVDIAFDLPPGHKLGDDGTRLDAWGRIAKSHSQIRLRWVSGSWQVADYSIRLGSS